MLNEYQRRAFHFALPTAQKLEYLIPGLAGEVGEVASVYAKAVRKGIPIDRQALLDELGDVLWFVAVTSYILGSTIEEVGEMNIQKLTKRKQDNTLDAVGKRCT
jgi:NTP pyrophosphatase (non-canonical NTP hydrolase)